MSRELSFQEAEDISCADGVHDKFIAFAADPEPCSAVELVRALYAHFIRTGMVTEVKPTEGVTK